MKRLPSRVPSPTSTVFVGLPNYLFTRPWLKVQDYHQQVWKIHYEELGRYLKSYLTSGTRVSLSFFDLIWHTCLSTSELTLQREIKVDKIDQWAISRTIYGRLRWDYSAKEWKRWGSPSCNLKISQGCVQFPFFLREKDFIPNATKRVKKWQLSLRHAVKISPATFISRQHEDALNSKLISPATFILGTSSVWSEPRYFP